METFSSIFRSLAVLFALTSLSVFPSALSLVCNEHDKATLLKVKAYFGNPLQLSTWTPATDCCGWDNIFCYDTGGGRVNKLFLTDETMSGPLPPEIGDLTDLDMLVVSDVPGIVGPFPPSLAKLKKLSTIEITNTSISGAIPAFFSELTSLSTLILTSNKLSGAIPTALGTLPNLAYLNLGSNHLTGSIPTIPTLSSIVLSDNHLSGVIPRSYGDAGFMTIDFSHNALTGDASFIFGEEKLRMEKIDISWNQLEFDITGVVFPKSLLYMDLSHNRIRGSLSPSFRALNGLRFLDLSYNLLCGRIPAGRSLYMRRPAPYLHNKCLCGFPLPACKKKVGS